MRKEVMERREGTKLWVFNAMVVPALLCVWLQNRDTAKEACK